MISPFEVYLWLQIDAFRDVMFVLVVVAFIGCIATMVRFTDTFADDDARSKGLKLFKRCLIVCVSMFIMGMAIPSTKNIAVMFIMPKIVNNKDVREIPELAMKMFMDKMREWEKEFSDAKPGQHEM